MTTTIVFATVDGQLNSSSTNYTTAQNGSSLGADTGGGTTRWGQDKISTTFHIWESFFSFPWTADAQTVVVSAFFDLYQESSQNPAISRTMRVREYDFGATLETADWRDPGDIASLTLLGSVVNAEDAALDHVLASEASLNDRLATNGPIRIVVYSDRFFQDIAPTTAEYSTLRTIEASGTSTDPALVVSTVPVHTLVRVGGAQAQLSDGQHVYLDANTGGDSPTVNIKRHNGTSESTIASNITSDNLGTSNQGMQSMALIVDDDDNIYVLCHTGGGGNTLSVKAWEKTGTNTWTARTRRSGAMPAVGAGAIINNIAATFHPHIGQGSIFVMVGHEAYDQGVIVTGQMSWAIVNVDFLLDGTGSFFRGSGDAIDSALISGTWISSHFNPYVNETGTSLDVVRFPGDSRRGVIICQTRVTPLGDYNTVSVTRYRLNSTGTGFTSVAGGNTVDHGIGAWGTKDAHAKLRVLPISSTQFAFVTMDKDAGWGASIFVIQNIGDSTTLTELGSTHLDDEDIATMPSASSLAPAFTWDAIYHPGANRILFYYFDTANNRRLMRTGFDLNTYQADQAEIEVATNIGASGSTNHAIRVQRGEVTISQVLISVANKTSGNVQSTIYVVDPLNIPPNAPILDAEPNYDATAANLFGWTFSDPNVGDTQTAYEFQIDNATTLASVVATGKVVSGTSSRNVTGGTLSNGNNYRWRVRTWDSEDEVGAWSAYGFFSTTAGGSVTILTPASDNPAGVITDNYTVTWSVSGTTQASYRVRVVRTDTEVQHSDTGFVTSTATSHEITGLLSDVEYRIEVTVRNAALVATNTATRLLTTNYNEPETPLITVQAINMGGYISVGVTNPAPTGDKPDIVTNQVQRRRVGDEEWVSVAEIGEDGSYQDYHVASGIAYEYQVVGVAPNGFATSETLSATLVLEGVWLHSPLDPAGTALNYRLGREQRSAKQSTPSALTYFAGREFPVADFAKHRSHSFSVTVDIPHGETWLTDLVALQDLDIQNMTLVYRDNRSRLAFGVIGGLDEQDQNWGSRVSFEFTRVDYTEAVV
jgi:hypothetical protein